MRAITPWVVLLLIFGDLAAAQPCYAENDGNAFNDAVSMGGPNLLLAIKFTPANSFPVAAMEVFTGEQTGPNTLGIWSHDAVQNQPLVDLGTGAWPMISINSWQGPPLPNVVALSAGVTYWVVWGPRNGAQSSQQATGITQQYRGSFTGGSSWTGPFQFPSTAWKFRLYCSAGVAVYQTNQNCSSLDIDSLQTSGQLPAVTTVGPGVPVTVNLGGLSGSPWDVGYQIDTPLVPSSLITAGGQIVNLDTTMPLAWLQGGTFTNSFLPFFSGLSLPASLVSVEAQMVIVDPSQVDGFCLSQAVQLQ